jgi:hypothetical protein
MKRSELLVAMFDRVLQGSRDIWSCLSVVLGVKG